MNAPITLSASASADLTEKERSVVGSLLYESPTSPLPNNIAKLLTNAPDAFLDIRFGHISFAIQRLMESGSPVDIGTVRDKLKTLNRLDYAGGETFLYQLPVGAPSLSLAEHDAESVWMEFQRRRLQSTLTESLAAIEAGHPLTIVASGAANTLAEIARGVGEKSGVKPLAIWSPSQFLAWTEPVGRHLLKPAYLSKSSLSTLIGQGGLGKSRLALWLAICQILGRKWCGLETGGEPQKWLFLGDENSVGRLKEDLAKMFSALTESEIVRVEQFLRLQAVGDVDDADVWLGDVETHARIAATIKQESPGVVVIDPLANFAPGDISKPGEMKEAVRLLVTLIRKSAPEAAILLLHHARTGRQNIAQGIGWDAANFASGGKPLFSAARCQINLMPGKADDDTRLVLHCAKANNCQRFETRGLIFDQETFAYSIDPEFDVDAWLADVEGRARSGQSLCTVADVVAAVRDGYTRTKSLVEHLHDAFLTSKRTAERLILKAVEAQGIVKLTRGQYALGRKADKISESIPYK